MKTSTQVRLFATFVAVALVASGCASTSWPPPYSAPGGELISSSESGELVDEPVEEPVVASSAVPYTQGCPAGAVENLAGGFVETSAEQELGDDPVVALPLFQQACIGYSANLGDVTTAFFGGDVALIEAIGRDLESLGFVSIGGFENGLYKRQGWQRDSPLMVIAVVTWGEEEGADSFGAGAVGLFTPYFTHMNVVTGN